MVNTPLVVAAAGLKFTFTVISTWSVACIGVMLTARPIVTHVVDETITTSDAVVALASAAGNTMAAKSLMSRLLCAKSNEFSAVADFAPRTEYVYAPAAPGSSRYVNVAARLQPLVKLDTTCSPTASTCTPFRNRAYFALTKAPWGFMFTLAKIMTLSVGYASATTVSTPPLAYVVVEMVVSVTPIVENAGYTGGTTIAAICRIWPFTLTDPCPMHTAE
jgi:hypothetical protein